MNNQQAAKLRPGHRVRRKRAGEAAEDDAREIYVVERVALPTNNARESVTVHAGGIAFKAWEIERFWRPGEQ